MLLQKVETDNYPSLHVKSWFKTIINAPIISVCCATINLQPIANLYFRFIDCFAI